MGQNIQFAINYLFMFSLFCLNFIYLSQNMVQNSEMDLYICPNKNGWLKQGDGGGDDLFSC